VGSRGWYAEKDVRLFAGVDEAGRGPLAGPVVAAVVVLQDGQLIDGVRDSKKLTARRRAELYLQIKREAADWAVGIAEVEEIDRLNILGGTMLAMRRALDGLKLMPQSLLIDGNQLPELPQAFISITETLVGGDDICPAIGAASILAKVERDRMMEKLHEQYPGYGFDRHKGYPTAAHRQALIDLGVTPVHRMSFRPVREAAKAVGSISE
jgi:ribonuclease HII